MRLCGMSGTRKALLAAIGSLASRSSNVSVVTMLSFDGVPRVTFGSCTSARLQIASRPSRVSDAAVSKNTVVDLGLGGLVQPGSKSCSISFTLLTALSRSAGSPRHFPFGLLPKPACNLLPPIVLWRVALDLWSALSFALGQVPLSCPFLTL